MKGRTVEPEDITVDLQVTIRPFQAVPDKIINVPLGGRHCVVLIGMSGDDHTPERLHIKMDGTGFDSIPDLVGTLKSLIEHMESQPYDEISSEGVRHVEPENKESGE